jgi:hypothetical protein
MYSEFCCGHFVLGGEQLLWSIHFPDVVVDVIFLQMLLDVR